MELTYQRTRLMGSERECICLPIIGDIVHIDNENVLEEVDIVGGHWKSSVLELSWRSELSSIQNSLQSELPQSPTMPSTNHSGFPNSSFYFPKSFQADTAHVGQPSQMLPSPLSLVPSPKLSIPSTFTSFSDDSIYAPQINRNPLGLSQKTCNFQKLSIFPLLYAKSLPWSVYQ